MIYLLTVSLIWAFSFGLIKSNLVSLEPNFVTFARLFISLLVFIPFLRLNNIPKNLIFKLTGIGALQFGLMYIAYIYSYQYLQSYEIVLFTIFTPLYITLINDLINKKVNKKFLAAALLAVVGAGIILFQKLHSHEFMYGFILVQISNVCFAAGQIFYTKVKKDLPGNSDHSLFGLLYLGAVIVTLPASLFSTDYSSLIILPGQLGTLIYLGVISSGLAFYLWNVGATKVNEGSLAVFNNLKIPLAMIVSIFIFGEEGDISKLFLGGLIIFAALFTNEWKGKTYLYKYFRK